MYEKIVGNKEELNAVAKHLRDIQNLDELRHLAKEWMVPCEDVENFITGKRYVLVEIEIEDKVYATAEEKLREEMWILKDRDFADILSQHLINKCKDDFFSSLVLQQHKTLHKCLNYVMEQAYQIAEKKYEEKKEEVQGRDQNVALALSEVQVYKWAEEYYLLDDAETEAKKKEEEKKKIQKEHEQVQKRKTASAKGGKPVGKKTKRNTELPKKDKAPEIKKEAQMSLFDVMTDNTDEGGKNEGV